MVAGEGSSSAEALARTIAELHKATQSLSAKAAGEGLTPTELRNVGHTRATLAREIVTSLAGDVELQTKAKGLLSELDRVIQIGQRKKLRGNK